MKEKRGNEGRRQAGQVVKWKKRRLTEIFVVGDEMGIGMGEEECHLLLHNHSFHNFSRTTMCG